MITGIVINLLSGIEYFGEYDISYESYKTYNQSA